MLWEFARDWHYRSTERIVCNDHDFATQSTWKVIPMWIYDIQNNKGMMVLNTSHDTSEFNCKAVEKWWLSLWKELYPNAKEIVCFADSWWSNWSRSLLYKHYLQLLSNNLNMPIRITHYAPYTSKYNLIEHRMFCHVHRACEWVMFTDLDIVQQTMAQTTTEQWLTVMVDVDGTIYEIGKKIPKEFEQIVRDIPHRDKILPQWNYVIYPNKEYKVII